MSLAFPPSTKIYLSLAPCDKRKGFDGLSAQVRNILQLDPFSGAVFLFRGKRGQLPTFSIRFAPRDDFVSVASVFRNDTAGGAFPTR